MTSTPTGTLHLIPVGMSDAPTNHWLPAQVQHCASELSIYIAENAKTARAFLKLIGTSRPLQDIVIHTLSEKTTVGEIKTWLQPARQGIDIGLVSEAGCPAVADPGAKVVEQAHTQKIRIQPWVGPSSIILGLMASGLDGQRFAFHGYAPIQAAERAQQLRTWENISLKSKQTQLLIETPYRNDTMFDTLINTLKGSTRLCIARSLTGSDQWILTQDIAQWKAGPKPDLNKKPTLFLFQAR